MTEGAGALMDMERSRFLWRQYCTSLKEIQSPRYDVSLAIAGSFTVDTLVPHIGGNLIHRGFRTPKIKVGPYNQIHQICLDYKTILGSEKLDGIILLWRLEDIFPDLLELSLGNDAASFERVFDELRRLTQAVRELRRSFEGSLIVSIPPYPSLASFDLKELNQYGSGQVLYREIINLWMKEIGDIEGVNHIDLHGLLMDQGYEPSHDVRKWYLYRQPYTETFCYSLGKTLSRMIASGKISSKKCIVLDCDNTLWGGIIGEDGLSGIELGNDFPGSGFRDFQKHILSLQSRGIILAVASKNNEQDVLEVFEKHDAMILHKEHISVFEVHWRSKVESIKKIANVLNIGLDSLVFIDDNAKEIGEIQERLPEVTCFLVPADPAFLPGLLKGSELFDISNITQEDKDRTRMMAQEAIRKQASEHMSEDDFKKSLGLKVKVFEVDAQQIARTVQLINKTNQFNLTTIRRTQDEVKALCQSQTTRVLAVEIQDRYGEYGLVGVCIVNKMPDPKIWMIDTLLMSCRVLGRGAETAFLNRVAQVVMSLGCTQLRGKYIPTPKNAMVEDLYHRHNFIYDKNNDEWYINPQDILVSPAYIETSLKLLSEKS